MPADAPAAPRKDRVLIIEDSRFYGSKLQGAISVRTPFVPVLARSFVEARQLLAHYKDNLLAALVDLNLPDAREGDAVQLVLAAGVPAIPITADTSEGMQESIWSQRITDYLLKEGPATLDTVVGLLLRLARNRDSKVLVVDDSRTSRARLRQLLEAQLLEVVEAESGAQALELLEATPGIRLLLTDFNMPAMDGVQLVGRVRLKHPLQKLAIIGLSSADANKVAVSFIKHGANDFIVKPFTPEQLYCRVAQNLEVLDQFETIRLLSETDTLTGLRNRRHLFSIAPVLAASAHRAGKPLCVAMLDIDHFKRINDTYGHPVGDEVISGVGHLLSKAFRASDVVARFGGEEFCVVATNMDPARATEKFEQIRREVAALSFGGEGGSFSATVSIGLCMDLSPSWEELLRTADLRLYDAKKGGRDRVVL